jgi:hypothetical protein
MIMIECLHHFQLKQQVVYVLMQRRQKWYVGVKRIGTSGAKLLQMEKVQHQNIKITITIKRFWLCFLFFSLIGKCPRKWLWISAERFPIYQDVKI